MFRNLKKEEISLRQGNISRNGITLLAYTDARSCMQQLDEEYGPLGWQDEYTDVVLPNGATKTRCRISVYDKDNGIWIHREDYGTSSSTEAAIYDKAVCSDAFKRTCTKLGIGRSLYKFPEIFIPSENNEIDKPGVRIEESASGELYTRDQFYVSDIVYAKDTNIVIALQISRIARTAEEKNRSVFIYDVRSEEDKVFESAERAKLQKIKNEQQEAMLFAAHEVLSDFEGASLLPDVGTEEIQHKQIWELTPPELKSVYANTKKHDVKNACLARAKAQNIKLY